MVAKVENEFYSIYDAKMQYTIGTPRHEKAQPKKGGGFYVYKDL